MSNGLGRRLLASLALGLAVALIVGFIAVLALGRAPRSIRLAAGQSGGMYEALALSLRDQLGAEGYEVTVIETAGSIDNAQLLRDSQVDIGLLQSGTEELTAIGKATALSEVFYEPLWLFARGGAIPLVDGIPALEGKRLSIGPAGSGTNAMARAITAQAGVDVQGLELSTSETIDSLRAGEIDGAFVVVAANAPVLQELVSIPGLEVLPIPNVEAFARRLPYLSPVMLFRGILSTSDPVVPPADMPMLAARATLMGREGLHPDLARLIVRELPDALPVPWIGERDAFPSLDQTTLPVNADAERFLAEGPTPLEAFLPFEIASPLSRVYLILLPLLVIAFPLYTLAKAAWGWFMNGRIVAWYPRIAAIERNLEASSLPELMTQQDFLRGLDDQLARQTRVPAGYMATYYDLRTDCAFVRRKVEARIVVLGGQAALDEARANDAGAPLDPRTISDADMGIHPSPRGGRSD